MSAIEIGFAWPCTRLDDGVVGQIDLVRGGDTPVAAADDALDRPVIDERQRDHAAEASRAARAR